MAAQSLVTRDLLFSFFAGRATALQKQLIRKWLGEDAGNEEFFYACLQEWETTHPQYTADTDAAIAKFQQRILAPASLPGQPEEENTPAVQAKLAKGWQRCLAAASVVFMILLGAWLFRDAIFNKSYATGNGEISAVTLEDGSKIVLNANSTLQVPRFGFAERSRQVHLRGEARFSVVHTPDDKKFIVSTGPAFQVEVLGTEFNISTRRSGTKVVLQKGKVKVHYGEEKQEAASLVMAPGDLVTLDEAQKKLQVEQVPHPENYSAWQHGRFVFEHTSLAEIREILQENYGLHVTLKGADVSKVTVSGSIKASNADELLLALAEILDINVVRQDDQVMLYRMK